MTPTPPEVYLGDGLYASFDGYSIWLRAPRPDGDHRVALEPAVYKALQEFIASLKKGTAVLVLSLVLSGAAMADTTITSRTDSLGYTHHTIRRPSGTVTGTSKTDTLGYTHTGFSDGTRCTAKTNSLGRRTERCH